MSMILNIICEKVMHHLSLHTENWIQALHVFYSLYLSQQTT